ncbi:MAG: CoA pyrophosphatase [SAR324 cluster bacterium]|nr:CoA pyrophosphatase [SAR324 cluster bacterium]
MYPTEPLQTLQERFKKYSPPTNIHVSQRASVLIPIFEKNAELNVLLTRRSTKLNSHAGQVSFPGGREEAFDTSPQETALRESYEEIGLLSSQVTILGKLDQILSRNFLIVTPVIGVIPEDFVARPDPIEIESVFHVPFSFFMQEENHVIKEFKTKRPYLSHHFYFEGYDIWGLTALLILRFLEIGLGYVPEYPVHHPKASTWMELSISFREEHTQELEEGWTRT